MHNKIPLVLFAAMILFNCSMPSKETSSPESTTTKIAFGSCGHQDHKLEIFNTIVSHHPDLFVFLGDNIYGDTKNMDTLRARYEKMGRKESFINLRKNVPVIATWDDHDFGWNDSGKSYRFKEESKEIFLNFFNEPDSSDRRKHPGVYQSYEYNYGDNTLRIILLDDRTFRDELKSYQGEFKSDSRYNFYQQDYAPHTDTAMTLLGSEQWQWLEQELKKPADIRIIGSGIQFGIEWNGYEAWANFPHEQQRMIDLIKKCKANGVVFITGDVHYSEISKINTSYYPLYDITASGLSETWDFATPNKNRIEGPVMENHFGLITIDWKDKDTTITLETWDANNNQRINHTIGLNEIQFAN